MILDELGIGTAGQGQNFNDIIRRANPALHSPARRSGSSPARRRSWRRSSTRPSDRRSGRRHTGDSRASSRSGGADAADRVARQRALASDRELPGLRRDPARARAARRRRPDGTPLLATDPCRGPELNRSPTGSARSWRPPSPAWRSSGRAPAAMPAIRETTPLVATLAPTRPLAASTRSAKLQRTSSRTASSRTSSSVVYYIAAATARYDASSHLRRVAGRPDNGICDDSQRRRSRLQCQLRPRHEDDGARVPRGDARRRRTTAGRHHRRTPAGTPGAPSHHAAHAHVDARETTVTARGTRRHTACDRADG